MNRKVVLYSAILVAVPLSHNAQGATTSQTIGFNTVFGGNFYDSSNSGESGTGYLDSISLSGFNKFDPALGTLTEVRVSLNIQASWNLGLQINDPDSQIIDPGNPFSIDFSLQSAIEAGVFYTPTGSNRLVSVATDTTFDSIGLNFTGDTGNTSASTGDSFGNPTAQGSIFPGVDEFNSADFVGVGTVQELTFGLLVPLDDIWITDNLNSAEAELSYQLEESDVTLEFIYTPVPEPSFLLLSLAGTVIGLTRRRR
ncbi:choice-of-anchor E domain-containing protein [Haloferula sp.]|uniref:choice-of-anchor E domain-containing protein n=1 Tax=Haloferula sp. TaxID=2497595 RepID=UPI003C758AC6